MPPKDPPRPSKEEYAQYDTLVKLVDLNEAAFKYLEYCTNPQQAANPAFMKNYKYVLDKLLTSTVKLQKSTEAKASRQIMQRRAELDAVLDDTLKKDGCDISVAHKGKEQYKFFTDFTSTKIDALIKEGMKTPL